MIRVLIVENALPVALLLKSMLDAQAGLRVVGHASDGAEALRLVHALRPDVIALAPRLPDDPGGVETTRRIMEELPTPIVLVGSAQDRADAQTPFRALELGAVAVYGSPPQLGDPRADARARELAELLQAMAGAKLVRRRRARPADAPARDPAAPRLLAVAASTGGPLALAAVLGGLPVELPVPVLVVQHISKGFLPGMVEWLGSRCRLPCGIAADGAELEAGRVYFAPDEHHLLVAASGTRLYARLSDGEPVDRHRPAATPLFAAIARECGARAIGLVLTGMGGDGATGLLELRRAGALTLAQSPASCVIDGMPEAAIRLGAVAEVVALAEIAPRLRRALGLAPARAAAEADPDQFGVTTVAALDAADGQLGDASGLNFAAQGEKR